MTYVDRAMTPTEKLREAARKLSPSAPQQVELSARQIQTLAPSNPSRNVPQSKQLFPQLEAEIEGIGMGVLSDGTPYLTQRGLALLCGVQNAHIGTISSQWGEAEEKPRIVSIKKILAASGYVADAAHIEIRQNGRLYFCYPAAICLAVLEYYAFDAGSNFQIEARENFRILAGSRLQQLIFSQLGYDVNNKSNDRFQKWHERIALNFQSAPQGFFHVFNEANTLIYELINAGATLDENFVPDISIGQIWSSYWTDNSLAEQFGHRCRWPHRYPPSHPQARSNPQESWCYPIEALGTYRRWLQGSYIGGGKFAHYLNRKVAKDGLAPSIAQLAIRTMASPQIAAPRD